MALFSSEQDYYQCLGKLHWNELVLITIILPVYIKSFPIVVKTLLGYVVWWTRDQTHESRGYPTRWSDYSQIESYRYSRSYVVNIIYLLIIVVGKVGLYAIYISGWLIECWLYGQIYTVSHQRTFNEFLLFTFFTVTLLIVTIDFLYVSVSVQLTVYCLTNHLSI